MTSQPAYLRYLASAKQADLAEQLRQQGFVVETDKIVNDVIFDLVASKGTQRIAYEFKSGPSSRSNPKGLEQLQRAAQQAGLQFRIVVVNPPPRVHVEIDNLSERLLEHMVNVSFPQELDSLSTHTEIHGVADIDISEIYVGDGSIRVTGTGSVDVLLRYGSDSGDASSSSDSFPIEFRVTLSADGSIEEVGELTVDTSSFYE